MLSALNVLLLAIFLYLRSGGVNGLGQEKSTSWVLTWSDEFSGPVGPPSSRYWTVRSNYTHGQKELQLYTRNEALLDGKGHLVLTTRAKRNFDKSGKLYNYSSGWVDTQDKFSQMYGKFEVRAKLPNPSVIGIWPAHWLMPERNAWNCWPVGGEISAKSGAWTCLQQPTTTFFLTCCG